MNVRNCRNCGRIFNYVAGIPLCQPCKEKMEEKFQEVKEYIRANPGVGIKEVSEACDVEASQIRQWLKDDRLELAEGSAILLNCEKCGQPIRSGRFCDKCKCSMTSGFKSILKENKSAPPVKQDKEGPKMRFLG